MICMSREKYWIGRSAIEFKLNYLDGTRILDSRVKTTRIDISVDEP